MGQTGTYTYNAAQVISNYLKPLCINEYNIKDTLQLPQLLKDLPPLKDHEEYISYDCKYLLTNILVKETIDYVLEQTHVHNKPSKVHKHYTCNISLGELHRAKYPQNFKKIY